MLNPGVQKNPKAKSASFIPKYWNNMLENERILQVKKWCEQISQLINDILTGKNGDVV